ncbi:mevalonate kinase [Ditylenchus destructor]|uniref:Mevalonate kinase n=1 Tax=Ditylenchus destructor TaxID=166010 RepID=A0AAD4QWW2_9BILA|nr:mevalonate kinase [Ditylenchus destructor]
MTSNSIHVSAPGKVILFGEHAVVYKKAALASAIDLRMHMTAIDSNDEKITLKLPDINLSIDWDLSEIQHCFRRINGVCYEHVRQLLAVNAFVFLYTAIHSEAKMSPTSMEITVRSEIPIQAGMGSSGAFCVCLASVLLQKTGLIPLASIKVSGENHTWSAEHLNMIRKFGSKAEEIIHGRASGIDTAICANGGLVKFQDGEIQNLKSKLSLNAILVNTKVERNTATMVGNVRGRYDKFPETLEPIFEAINSITLKAEQIICTSSDDSNAAIQTDDVDAQQDKSVTLQELCELNNGLLVTLGVGHQKSDHVCNILKEYEMSGKITGAGGGGCVFAFAKSGTDNQRVQARLQTEGFDVWIAPLDCPGLISHTESN